MTPSAARLRFVAIALRWWNALDNTATASVGLPFMINTLCPNEMGSNSGDHLERKVPLRRLSGYLRCFSLQSRRERLAFWSGVSLYSAVPGLPSSVDVPEVDLRDQRLRDQIERVDLRLHCGVRYLRRHGRDEKGVVRGDEVLPVDSQVEQRVSQLLVGQLVRLRKVDQVLELGVRDHQRRYRRDRSGSVSAGLMCEDVPYEREVLYLREVLHAYLQRGTPGRVDFGEG